MDDFYFFTAEAQGGAEATQRKTIKNSAKTLRLCGEMKKHDECNQFDLIPKLRFFFDSQKFGGGSVQQFLFSGFVQVLH